jgi:serine/threonine-protein kinase
LIGKQLAHFEVLEKIGEGGMGQVYRALDTTLDREVALKLLPPDLAEDAERIARLKREAKTLASIHHPRVASLFGLQEADGSTFLVMELVEGPTLAEMLEAGPMRRDDAVRIALQIAEGLEEAHSKGVIHRDLKPANIKVTPGDQVKILDFGLARAYAGEPMSGDDLANSPTITQAMTRAGVILGTAAYMSPEQAKGKPVDLRSDIWSFGVILFEMLCGGQMFEGETVSETMAEVLKGDLEWSRLPTDTPPWVRRLLDRCLDRNPMTRLQSIGEARVALERGGPDVEAATQSGQPAPSAPTRSRWPIPAALLILAVAIIWFGLRDGAPEQPSLRFQLNNPHVANLRQGGGRHISISPDGSRVATIGAGPNDMILYVRDFDSFDWTPIPGTDEAGAPVFSPDGRWLAFLANRSLSKVNLNGGAPIQLHQASGFIQGMSWADDGYIYGSYSGEFWRIPESGGEREVIHVMDAEHTGRIGPPHVLPGSKALLFHTGGEGATFSQVHALDLESKSVKNLGLMGTDPRYVGTGALVFAQGGQVLAVDFDTSALEVKGSPIPVFDRVWIEEANMHLDVSADGTVAYLPNLGNNRPELLVVNRDGGSRPLVQSEMPFESISDPRLSPDGNRLIVSANRLQVWMIDLPTETPTLLSESGFYPVWSTDGAEVTYGTTRSRSYDIMRVPANLSRAEELLLDWENNLRTAEMAPDGTLIIREEIPGKGMDLKIWPDADPESIKPLLEGPDDELAPTVSPDGKWMAFVSDLSGQDEVYVTSFPEATGRIQISSGGGTSPAWGTDGRELFYTQRDAIVSAKIEAEGGVRVLSREELFSGPYLQYRQDTAGSQVATASSGSAIERSRL